MNRRHALLAIHLGAFLFGLSGVFGKLAQTDALTITLGRALFGLLALWLVGLLLKTGGARPNARQCLVLMGGGLLLGGHWLTFFIAVKVAGVGIATLGFASFPAFTVLLEGALFRERTRPIEFGLVGLVCLGLILVAPLGEPDNDATRGLLYGIASGLMFALLSLLNRASTRGLDPLRASFWQNLAIVLALAPFAASALPGVAPLDWLWLALLGVFCTGLAHSLFVASLRVLNARTTSVIFALEPVYGIAIAWWLFAEQPTLQMLLGGALIILASIGTSRLKQAAPPVDQTLPARSKP